MLDEVVKASIKQQYIPGLALAIIQKGCTLEMRGYGLANLEHNVLVTPETVFELGSITKPFTALAISHLVEQGKITLDDKISDYLAALPDSWNSITIWHLLTHTSGIADYFSAIDASQSSLWQPHYLNKKIIEVVADLPLKFQPGEDAEYCNTGFVLLGFLLEEISNKTYADFIQEVICEPLDMASTCSYDNAVVVPSRAQGYQLVSKENSNPWRNRPFLDPALWDNAAGGLVSNLIDLVKWNAALFNENIFDQSSLAQMWTPATLNSGEKIDYGLGWVVMNLKGCKCVGHEGRRPGFSTSFMHFMEENLTIILLCNQGNIYDVNLENLTLEIAHLYA